MQININPINNKPVFCANKTQEIVKISSESYKKVDSLRRACKEIFEKINFNQSLIETVSSNFEKFKLNTQEVLFSLSDSEALRILMPTTATKNLFVIQDLKNNKPNNTIILTDINYLVEAIKYKDEVFETSNIEDKNSIENFISKVFDSMDFPLLKLRIFLNKEFKENNWTIKGENIVTKPAETSEKAVEIIKKSAATIYKDWREYSMQEIMRNNSTPQTSPNRKTKPIQKTKPKIEKNKKILLPNSFVNTELKENIAEMKSLYSQIKKFLESKSLSTNVKIFNGFPDLKRKDSKGLSFQDVKILFIKNEKSPEELIFIKDLNTSDCAYLTESGKVLNTKQEKINFVRFFENPKYLSQQEIDAKTNRLKTLINKSLRNIKNFKTYIDNQGWRVRKNKEILEQNYGFIDNTLQEKITFIKTKYDNIRNIFDSMSYYNASKIKTAYGKILTSATSRLEFINSSNDNLNLAFDFSTNKYGEFYKIAKHSGGENVEELYLITPDGKIVKNAVKNQGLKSPFPTGGQADVKYFSQEELDNVNLENLENILNEFCEKITDYENFILNSNKKATEKQIKKAEKLIEQNKIKITFDAVKSFLDKTVSELQTSANQYSEGNKNPVETIANDLKSKFEEFLSQFKTK